MVQLGSAPGFEPRSGAAIKMNIGKNNVGCVSRVCVFVLVNQECMFLIAPFCRQGCISLISQHVPFCVHMHPGQACTMSLQPWRATVCRSIPPSTLCCVFVVVCRSS